MANTNKTETVVAKATPATETLQVIYMDNAIGAEPTNEAKTLGIAHIDEQYTIKGEPQGTFTPIQFGDKIGYIKTWLTRKVSL